MTIQVQCPSCGFAFQVEARFAGRRGFCPLPECRREYRVPAAGQLPETQTSDDRTSQAVPAKISHLPAGSRLPKLVYVALSTLVGSLLLLAAAAAFLPARPPAAAAGETAAVDDSARPQAEVDEEEQIFQQSVRPFLTKYCYECHGPDAETEGIAFHRYDDSAAVVNARKLWEKALRQVKARAMPPADHEQQPNVAERKIFVDWLDKALYDVDCDTVDDPGRVTIRRLNRAEYNNTIRDLIGVDFQPASDFPSDDVGYGFDNIGDVLSLPPLLMEKYLDAAEEIAAAAIVESIGDDNVQRFSAEKLDRGKWNLAGDGFIGLYSSGEVSAAVEFPFDGEYLLRAEAKADQAGPEPARMQLLLDGKSVKVFDIEGESKAAVYETKFRVEKGKRKFAAAFINDYYRPQAEDPGERDRNLAVRTLEVVGPLNVAPEDLPESHRRIVVVRPGENKSVRDAAVEVFRRFAARAFRRPATADELARLADLVEAAIERGETFEQGVQIGVQAVLVSPHFLFRIENDDRPHDPAARHNLGDYELATRLSYFLWSSLPDDELFELAEAGQLHEPDVLEKQVRRMLKDPKSAALVENFGRQWLNLRNLADIRPDPERFPAFSDELRADMLRETDRFFLELIREDGSLLDFLDAKYSYVNQRLAQHYGIEGVEGEEFRRVSLEGTPRAGVLTQASVLMVTSDPTKTKPVLRGKWVLENILGEPPPDPPANVPPLEETAQANPDLPLREQLSLHRSNPVCASCHVTMDAIGFGFENFDAIGRWREQDGNHAIDPSGKLPSGETFASPAELVQILRKREQEFARCLAEKLLTYAIGRGLEYYDRCAIDKIVAGAGESDYRFSSLVVEIVNSRPFLMRRGEKPPE